MLIETHEITLKYFKFDSILTLKAANFYIQRFFTMNLKLHIDFCLFATDNQFKKYDLIEESEKC